MYPHPYYFDAVRFETEQRVTAHRREIEARSATQDTRPAEGRLSSFAGVFTVVVRTLRTWGGLRPSRA